MEPVRIRESRSYVITYSILLAPLPVQGYFATIRVGGIGRHLCRAMPPSISNVFYLKTQRDKMGHLLERCELQTTGIKQL